MEKTTWKFLFATLFIAIIFAVQFSAVQAAKPLSYASPLDLTQFGGISSYAYDINDKGQVVGFWGPSSDSAAAHAFVWSSAEGKVDLDTPEGSNSVAFTINKFGQIAGFYVTPVDSDDSGYFDCAVLWTSANTAVILDPEGDFSSQSRDINDKGQVVGYIESGEVIIPEKGRGAPHAFLWEPKTGWALIDVGLEGAAGSVASGINNKGEVVGYTVICDDEGNIVGTRAFIWTVKDGTVFLEQPEGAVSTMAVDINDKGDIVGHYTTSESGDPYAILWTKKGSIVEIETLPDIQRSRVHAINDKGQVVGFYFASGMQRAFYWTAESGMVELSGLSSDRQSIAYAVNAKGQIAGVSFKESSGSHAVVWNIVK
jgi:probable HAF family extracellular repeat protein